MRIAVLYSFEPQAGIIDGFKNLGHNVENFYYGKIKITFLRRIEWRLLKNVDKYLTRNFNNEIKNIQQSHQKNKFDILLVIKGKKINKLSAEILTSMNSTYKILWTTDSVVRFPNQLNVKYFCDSIFVQDGEDVSLVKNSEWLPLGYDSNLYKKGRVKNIDILFFGNCDNTYYKKREMYFVEASKLGKVLNIKFVGFNMSEKAKRILKQNNVEIIEKAPFNEFTSLVSKSKIALNIHQDDGKQAINPLFFAIPSCGTIQVTDVRDYYTKWLSVGVDFHPVEIEDLNTKLMNIFENIESYKVNEDKIYLQHSFVSRAKKLLENM